VKGISYVSLLVTIALVCGVANAGTSSTSRSTDESTIRKIDEAWSHAAETGDLAGVVAPYASHGSILPFRSPMATGTEAIQQVWSALMAMPGYSLKFSPTSITVAKSGEMAWEVGTFELTLNDPQGKPTAIPGKYVVTWEKTSGGWKVAADIFNTDN
jgi:ketosteroid isomerase-like protein